MYVYYIIILYYKCLLQTFFTVYTFVYDLNNTNKYYICVCIFFTPSCNRFLFFVFLDILHGHHNCGVSLCGSLASVGEIQQVRNPLQKGRMVPI